MVEPVAWKDYDKETGVGDPSTPLTAEVLLDQQAWVISQVDAAATHATTAGNYAAQAEAAAATASAPTDDIVAALIDTPGSETRVALDARATTIADERAAAAVAASGLAFGIANAGDFGEYGTADDTAVAQAALNAGAPVVFFPEGMWNVDPLYAPATVQRVYGVPGATTLKRLPATVTNPDSIGVLNVHGTTSAHREDVVVEDLILDGNKANITVDTGSGGDVYDTECLSMVYVDRPRIRNVRVHDATSEGFDFDYCTDGSVTDSYASGCGGAGVHFSTGCERMVASRVTAVSCGADRSRGGIDAHSTSSDCRFESCTTITCYRGYTLMGPGTKAMNCDDYGSTYNNFRIEGVDCQIIGGSGSDCPAGNGITVAASGLYALVSGVTVTGSSDAGIRTIAGAVGSRITGCTIGNTGGQWIYNQAAYCTVVGNTGRGTGYYTIGGTSTYSAGNVTVP